jgi:serine/threonine protein kinase
MSMNIKNTSDSLLESSLNSLTPSSDSSLNQRYRILAKIGSGGMGDVFLGIQRGAVDFQRLIVLKQIHGHLLDQQNQRQMFVDEASLVASLAHPHIVKIVDFRQTDNSFFIIMEYVDGETLKVIRSMCQRRRIPLPFPIACKLIMSACEALHYAHNATSRDGRPLNIIHRDIGLHNLMIDRNGYLKVIDFGIAKSTIQSDKTLPGLLKGNPCYMAPDLFRYTTIDHRVDIYALGLCLHELLTQQRAYHFEKNVQLAQIIHQVTRHELVAPSAIVSSVPTDLDEIVAKATAKDRDERYNTVEELASDLRGFANLNTSEFEENDVRTWFTQNFEDRIQERIQFEQDVLESAKNKPDESYARICSYAPQPPAGATEMMARSATSIQQVSGMKPMQLTIIIGCLFLFSVISAAVIYSFLNRSTDEAEKTTENTRQPNLIINSSPSGTEVYVDGEHYGVIYGREGSFWISPEEKHLVELKKVGYTDYAIALRVSKDGQQRIATSLKLEPAVSGVETSTSSPPELEVEQQPAPIQKKVTYPKRVYRRMRRNRSEPESPSPAPEVDQKPAPPAAVAKPKPKTKAAVPLLDAPKNPKVPLLDKPQQSNVPLI